MAKITRKLQLTLPKALAERFGVKPGDEVEWVAAGDAIRLVLARRRPADLDVSQRLELFDQATQRQEERQSHVSAGPAPSGGRGWSREELYPRGRTH